MGGNKTVSNRALISTATSSFPRKPAVPAAAIPEPMNSTVGRFNSTYGNSGVPRPIKGRSDLPLQLQTISRKPLSRTQRPATAAAAVAPASSRTVQFRDTVRLASSTGGLGATTIRRTALPMMSATAPARPQTAPSYCSRPGVFHPAPLVPGYSGFVRGLQHVAGRSYGKATYRALRKDPLRLVGSDMIPAAPQSNAKLPNKPSSGFVPGYAGFVPGTRDRIGETYNMSTSHSSMSCSKGLMAKTGRRQLTSHIFDPPAATHHGL